MPIFGTIASRLEAPNYYLREDTHKKSVFFSGRTTMGVPTTKQKTTFFLQMEKIHREAA